MTVRLPSSFQSGTRDPCTCSSREAACGTDGPARAASRIFAGVSLEVGAALPAISATGAGYDAYVTLDASGTFSQAKREAGLLRMQQAGVVVSDCATLMVEALADNAAPESGDLYAALDMPFAVLVGQVSAAHQS
ncbi:hypothetical protein [Streptomyces sp. NPDC087294]|uniref:hypothetical protein n=1 Tax=Streptomyces sp. NPDC087294 TaxID=3365777 RepID=UPI00380BBBED